MTIRLPTNLSSLSDHGRNTQATITDPNLRTHYVYIFTEKTASTHPCAGHDPGRGIDPSKGQRTQPRRQERKVPLGQRFHRDQCRAQGTDSPGDAEHPAGLTSPAK